MSEQQPIPDDHCTVTIVDEILGTIQVFHLPSTVAEAERDCVEVLRAKYFLKWCDPGDCPFILLESEGDRPEPIGVAIIEKPHAITVVWHAVGFREDAVARRREVLKGIWVMGGGAHHDE